MPEEKTCPVCEEKFTPPPTRKKQVYSGKMVPPLTEKHILPRGTLSFSAMKDQPLVFYTTKAGYRGNMGMGKDNEGKEFVLIPVEYLKRE